MYSMDIKEHTIKFNRCGIESAERELIMNALF
jgi:hypothetical protein